MSTAIYTRLSKDGNKNTDNEGEAVARQEKACRALAKRRGWNDIVVFQDNDKSASNRRKPRPDYIALCEAISNGDVKRLIAWAPDRLIRDPRSDLEPFIAIAEEAGLEIDTVQSGSYDLTTPMGRMAARIFAATARAEMELKSERTKDKFAQQAREGIPAGGHRTYGWTEGMKSIVPAEAAILREAAERVIAGEPLRAITADFNRREIPTANGGQWWGQVLRKLLIHPRLIGKRNYLGELMDGNWKPILDADTFAQVDAILTDPRRNKTRKGTVYPLTGLMFDHRGFLMGGAPGGKAGLRRYRTNVPSGVKNTQIGAATVEPMIFGEILNLSDTESFPLLEGSTDDIDTVKSLEAELAELSDLKLAGRLTTMEYLTFRDPLVEKLTVAKSSVKAVAAVPQWLRDLDKPGALRKAWPKLDDGQKRRVVELFVERIVIGAGSGTERVTVTWKG